MQVCQTEDFFDCQPAVLAAFKYSKIFSNGGVDWEEEERKAAKEREEKGEEEKEKTEEEEQKEQELLRNRESLKLEEFRVFLKALRQYYIYCQVRLS